MNHNIRSTARMVGVWLTAFCLLSAVFATMEQEAALYRIKDIRCDEKVDVGQAIRVRVRIENEGSMNPGTLLTVIGSQGTSTILLTPENGLLVFAEPDGDATEKVFLYSAVTSGDIRWQAAIEGDRASCRTQVQSGQEEPPDEEPPDDGGGGDPTGLNIIALHDSSSPQRDRDCTDSSCHASVLTAQSLDPSIPNIHVTMLPNTPGEDADDRCVFCHRTVELRSGGLERMFVRKRVDAGLCAFCHSPFGPGSQLYQTGRSLNQPDGAALYALLCSSCHRSLADSEVSGEDADDIREALDDNEGGMGPLRFLTDQEIAAIAAVLAENH